VALGAKLACPVFVHWQHGRPLLQRLGKSLHVTRSVSLGPVTFAPISVSNTHLWAWDWYDAIGQRVQSLHLQAVLEETILEEGVLGGKCQQEPNMSPEERKALDVQLKVWHLERRHCVANTSVPRLSLLEVLVPVRGLVHHRHVPILSCADLHNSLTPQMATFPRVSVASAKILRRSAPLSRAWRKAASDGSSTQGPHAWINPEEYAGTISIWKTIVHLVVRVRPLTGVTLSLPPCRALLLWPCQLIEIHRSLKENRRRIPIALHLGRELALAGFNCRYVEGLPL